MTCPHLPRVAHSHALPIGAAGPHRERMADDDPHRSTPQTAGRTDVVALLAAHPDAVARLIRDHVPDPHQRCRACTTPGTGTPHAHWPCILAGLARAAAGLTPPTATTTP